MEVVEPWYTSVNKVGKGYLLLFALHMGSKIDNRLRKKYENLTRARRLAAVFTQWRGQR